MLLGATGFVGSAICRRIGNAGQRIEARALVRGDLARLASPHIVSVLGQLGEVPRELFPAEPYVVIHFATRQVDSDGTGFAKVNVEGTRSLLQSLTPGCMGVLYGSSLSVYGQGPQEGHDEDAPLCPETALAQSRVEAERLILEEAERRGWSVFLLRPRFVLGQGDRSTLPGIYKLLRRGIGIGTGKQAYTIVDVDDYAAMLLRLAERVAVRAAEERPCRSALHVGYAQPVTFDDMVSVLAERFSLSAPRLRVPVGAGFCRFLRRGPSRSLQSLATKLELLGLPHHVCTDRLAQELGEPYGIVQRDPMVVLRRAADLLYREAQ